MLLLSVSLLTRRRPQVEAAHQIQDGERRQTLMMESVNHRGSSPNAPLPFNPLSTWETHHQVRSSLTFLMLKFSSTYAAKNLEQGKKYRWTEVNPEEMKKYVGLMLYMAVLDLPKLSDFWWVNTIFHVATPATIMSRDRFMAITSSVHMSDPTQDVENEKKKGTEDYDLLHRVRPLLSMMRIRCMAVYHPKQHIAVDERMVCTKARLAIKQYMRDKPTKRGLKFFVLVDVNGYTLDFKLYSGKFASGKGLSFDVVTGLVNKDYLGSGYVVYVDNFYTSPLLLRHLGQQGFGACGTYRQGRVGVPTTQENALTKKSPRGWIRDGGLLFVKWMDTREVCLRSTFHPVYSGDRRQVMQKARRSPSPDPQL